MQKLNLTKTLTLLIISKLLLASATVYAQETKMPVMEILYWESKSGVDDKDMVEAVDGIVDDLETLPGFFHQSLSKTSEGRWVDVYYWRTESDAHNSNDLMSEKPSFLHLVSLIRPDSISIEIMKVEQQSGSLNFE